MRPARTFRTVAVTVALTALAACGGGAGKSTAARDLSADLRARHGAATGARPFDSLNDLLGNVRYQQGAGPARPLTEAVVVGRVVDVEPGRGFRIEGDDAPDGIETSFDDRRALWRTVHVHVEVESVVSGSVPRGPIVVGFAFGPHTSLSTARDGFEAFGKVLLFLNRSPVFAYDPSLFGVVQDGALVGVVDGSGAVRLPAMEDDEATELLSGSSTVAQLMLAARAPQRVVELGPTGERVRR